MNNVIVDFGQHIQRKFGTSIEFSRAETVGQSHCPTVYITLYCPYGEYKGCGSNQKEAKKGAILACIEDKGIRL